MTSPRPDPLFLAFEAAVGRSPAAGRGSPDLGLARRVIAAGRRVFAAEPCPVAALRRAEALFVPRAARGLAGLLRLLFDSLTPGPAAAPALRGRGGPRSLRFGGAAGTLDVEIATHPEGGRVLRVAADATLAHPRSQFVARVGRREVRLAWRHGVGTARLPATARSVTLLVRRDGRVLARTPSVRLGRA
jgi:hypothetical protein